MSQRRVPEMNSYKQELEWMASFVFDKLNCTHRLGQKPDDRDWKTQRVKAIQKINELKERLDSLSTDSHHQKVAGNGPKKLCTGSSVDETVSDVDTVDRPVGIGGTITESSRAASTYGTSIMSTYFSGVSNGLSATMQWCDQAIGNISSFINPSNIFIKEIPDVVGTVSAQYLNEVEAVLKLDEEFSRPLRQWLNFSWELDTNFKAIFGVSLAHPKWQSITRIFYECSKLVASEKDFDAILAFVVQREYSVEIGNDIQEESLQKFFQELSICPQFANRIRMALSVLSQSTEDIWFFRDGVRAYRSFLGVSGSAFVPDLAGHNTLIQTPNDVSDFGFLKATGLAINVVSLINAASIIRHGKSKYSDAIKTIENCLVWELTKMENL